MSKIEIKPFEEQIRIAAISGELERAEERGHANGQEEVISKLLEIYSPEKVSKMTDIPLKRIQKIKNDG